MSTKLKKIARLPNYSPDYHVSAQVGTYIVLDGRDIGECLLSCADWDAADFRWPNPIPAWRESRAIACNVYVTGRTVQYGGYMDKVRVKVEWVGDGEPNEYVSGWMCFDDRVKREYAGVLSA